MESVAKEATASTVMELIDLVNYCTRTGKVRTVKFAPFELKNLLCSSIGKLTINKNLLKLDKLGIIQLKRTGIYARERGHCFSRWAILIKHGLVLFKTVMTSLRFSSSEDCKYNNTFIEGALIRPPPLFKDEEAIEKEFEYESFKNQRSAFNSPSNLEEIYIGVKPKAQISRQKNALKGALKKSGIWKAFGFCDDYEQNPIKFYDNFWEFLQTLQGIKNLIGYVIADFKGKKINWDKFLKWADERHEERKREKMRKIEKNRENVDCIKNYERQHTDEVFDGDGEFDLSALIAKLELMQNMQ